jgi:hypothetical protein
VIREEHRELLQALGELQATADAGVLELKRIRKHVCGKAGGACGPPPRR